MRNKHGPLITTERAVWAIITEACWSLDYISNLAWSRLGMELVELAEIAVDREVFKSS